MISTMTGHGRKTIQIHAMGTWLQAVCARALKTSVKWKGLATIARGNDIELFWPNQNCRCPADRGVQKSKIGNHVLPNSGQSNRRNIACDLGLSVTIRHDRGYRSARPLGSCWSRFN